MGILGLLLLGGVVGRLSDFFINKKGGVIRNIIVGIVGSILGGLVFQFFGGAGITGFNLYSLAVGVVGSILLVSLIQAVAD